MAADLDRALVAAIRITGRPVVVAIDGRSGVGKSTFASLLADRHQGRVVVSDDFWCGLSAEDLFALAPAERADVCIDWQRIASEVLEPLRRAKVACWQPFDWETGAGLSSRVLTCPPAPVIVLEGAYSGREELRPFVDLTVLITLDDLTRRARLVSREGAEAMTGWHGLWDEAEDHYFALLQPPQSFDFVLEGTNALRTIGHDVHGERSEHPNHHPHS